MLEDNLVKGRFYFANGDFFQGTFKDNKISKGQYSQAAGAKVSCEQTEFVNGVPEGTLDKAQKFTVVSSNGDSITLFGSFKNGRPVGEITLTVNDVTSTIDSPFDGSSEPVAAEKAPAAEEEKKEEAAAIEEPAPTEQPAEEIKGEPAPV